MATDDGITPDDEYTNSIFDDDAGKCPKCGATLEMRFGRHGHFWGCSKYPKCKYTRSLSCEEDPEGLDIVDCYNDYN